MTSARTLRSFLAGGERFWFLVFLLVCARGNLHAADFVRGDVNVDEKVDMADAIGTLEFLFLGTRQIECLDAADMDDSGGVNIGDPLSLLTYLFGGGEPPPPPPPSECGEDPTDDALLCPVFDLCPVGPETSSWRRRLTS